MRRSRVSVLEQDETSAKFCLRVFANEKGGQTAAFLTGVTYWPQLPAPPSVVTARRFCDQQEMSSQTATGRSLP